MPSNPELWARLDAYGLDDPEARLDFTSRLARENGWWHARAACVVAEYKRFLYLTQVAEGTMTPSDAVDQAWHLHLTYTRDYWGRLCGDVLGRPLHHGPTRGGGAEDRRYRGCYEATRARYETEFGYPPPPDIWPEADVRFGEAAACRRVNTARAWVIPRPRWPRRSGLALRASLAACALLLGGASLAWADDNDGFDDDAIIVIALVAVFVVGMLLNIRAASRRRPRRGSRHDGGSGCGGSGGGSDGGSGCGSGGCGGD